MKNKILAILAILPTLSFAQNVVYKCTSSNGDVNYINITTLVSKSTCVKTNLFVPASSPVKHTFTKNNSSSNSNVNLAVFNPEQKSRDSQRQVILTKELQDEQEQLSSVDKMLKNLDSTKAADARQIEQLSSLQVTHNRNIETLKKELNIKENSPPITLPTPISTVNLKIEKSENDISKISTK